MSDRSAPTEHLGQQALESYLWGAANILRGLIDAGAELGAEQLPGRERASNGYVAGLLLPTRTPSDGSGNADEDNDLNTVPESAASWASLGTGASVAAKQPPTRSLSTNSPDA